MTPSQKLKHMVLQLCMAWDDQLAPGAITAENIDHLYDSTEDKQDAINEIRGGQVETGLPAPNSRHYEPVEVAAKAPDGSWIGWTYWTGGGKHSNPEEIDWISDAYALDCAEKEEVVVVRTFTKPEAVPAE